MPVIGIDHIQLAMPALGEAAARRFYRDVLGLKELPKPESLAGRGGVWFDCGALQLHLGVEANFKPALKAHPGLIVDNLDDIIATLSQNNYAITRDIPIAGFHRIFTADPFGNRIELLQRTR